MPRKVSRNMRCAFCRGDVETGAYLEVEVTLPGAVGPQRQLFGAHADCMSRAMADGYNVEVDLLEDPEEVELEV